MRVNRFYISILIILIFSTIRAQKYLPPEVLSVEDGLSSRQVNSLTVDSYGFIWAGTQYGLNRFDGYHFRQFFTTITSSGYSGIQLIHETKIDYEGNLWVLNEGGINRIDHYTGDMTKYPVSMFDAVYKKESKLIDLCPADDGTIWILSDRSVTALSSDQIFNTYLIPDEFLEADYFPTCIASDPNGNIWIGTSGGLLVFSTQQKVFREIAGKNSEGLLSNDYIHCLFLDYEKSLWIGTQRGLNRVDPVDFAFYHYFPEGNQSAAPSNTILDIASSNKNEIVLATNAGVILYNTAELAFESVFSLAENSLKTVAVDSSGIIWAGTSQGILKIRVPKLNIRNYNERSTGLKLAHNKVMTMFPGMTNYVFIGYEGDGFTLVDNRTLAENHFKTLDGTVVTGICPFREQKYLISTEHHIELFDFERNSRASLINQYKFIKKSLIEPVKINCLFFDGDKTLWLGTSDGIQYIRFDSAKHISKKYLDYRNQQANIGCVYDIKQDRSGNLWIGADQGLFFYNPVKGNYNRYTPYDVNMLNTEQKEVYTIVHEKSDIFWLGTSSGVYRFNSTTREFTSIADKPELINASVRTLAVDKNNNLWIGTETGLFYYTKSNGRVKTYDTKEGLVNNSYSAICEINGLLFLGGNQGLSVIDLPEIKPSAIPNVVITSIRYLENNPNKPDLYYQVPDSIFLPWYRKALQIEFAVLDLARPELNQFRYSFGKTKENPQWQQLGSQNYIVLDHLSPGKYRLKVTGSDSDMNWNNKGTSVVIILEAPYWRSTIGIVIIGLVGLFMIFLFFRFWIRQFFNLSRENQEREMFAKQIMLQKEELTLKNKSITDSINYAKRIQTAMLPPYKLFKSVFPSSFILFMPKDIVSGDFYWVNKLGNRIFVSAVDCTGHGVPGAFMSIIGFELFRKITNIEGLTRPSDILNRLNDDFHEIFKDVDNVVLRDGMDVAFCSIDKKDMILEYAGAFNPLYLIRDNKITEIKGDRFAIGLDETNFREQTFKNHIIPIQKGDIIYIFSDGFSDQFGGPEGKKYKYRRFRHLLLNLHQLPMEKQHEILENNVMEWRGNQEQVDDILVIGIKIDF